MAPKKETVQKMFDDISGKYDFLNHFLSLGIDVLWRKRLVKMVRKSNPGNILDVATGTGDLAFALANMKPQSIVGIDISEKMLAVAKRKSSERSLDHLIRFEQNDAQHIPFKDGSFDAVTVAFGVRNFEDLKAGLTEMNRILKPGGCMLILEFSHPRKTPFKQLYGFYSRYVIPFFGKLISRHSEAYRYLPESVAAFPSGDDFLAIMKSVGIHNCSTTTLSMGIASIYYGERSA